jgi:hypothetical protein
MTSDAISMVSGVAMAYFLAGIVQK